MWFIVAFSVVTVLLSYLYIKKVSRMKHITADMPGPTALPVIGCALRFGTNTDEIFRDVNKIIEEFGTVAKVWLGPELFVLLSSVDDVELVLSSNLLINKNFTYDSFKEWLGISLLTAPGETWRKKRKLLTPAFHFQILEQFIDVFSNKSAILIDCLKSKTGEPGFNIVHNITLCTLDIIAESAMGVNIDAQGKATSTFANSIHEITNAVLYRIFKPWLQLDWVFRLSKTGRNYHKHKKIVMDFVDEVIRNRKQKRLESKSSGGPEITSQAEVIGIKKRTAFLDLLLDFCDAGGSLTDEDLRHEVSTFMFAGHDTSTSVISFTIYALMKHQDVQEKVLKELNEIFNDSEAMPTYSDLQNMKYLEKVIKETMRLWPAVPYIGRSATEDIKLKSGYTVPQGSSLVLYLMQLHYDPKYFPEPEVFDPERFEIENLRERNPYSYCPFSAGPRNCIGQKYSMLEMKMIISTIVRNFKILPPIGLPDINLKAELILRSSTGVNVRLLKRKD